MLDVEALSDGDVIYNRVTGVTAHYAGSWMGPGRLMVDGELTARHGTFIHVMMMDVPEYDVWHVDDCEWMGPIAK